jgi:4-amino-4-deoxy-L-arabinose transferase-like glycosyltransferase
MSRHEEVIGPLAAPASLGRAPVVLGLLAAWLLLTAAWRPLTLPDEGRYVGVAWEMLHGDLLMPTLMGLPYFHKPPLMYWIDAGAMHLLGANEFAARLAPALGAWLMGAAMWWHLRRTAGPRTAAGVLAVLATMPFYFGGGQFANHDMLVAGCITVAILCAVAAVQAPEGGALGWVIGAWVAAAAGVLAKGLIGVVLPALVLLPWLVAARRWQALGRLLHPAGPALFLLVAAPWFVMMQRRVPGFLDYFFVEQHFRRYAAGGFNNPQPFWFLFVVLPLLTLPWSLWLPRAWRAWRGDAAGSPTDRGLTALYAWWVLVVVLFFSLPRSKLIGYVLPALAPWAALLGPAVVRGRAWRWVLPLAALACVAVIGGVAWKAPASHRDIGLALRERTQAGGRLVLVDAPFFDVAFYARTTVPPIMLADWNDPGIPTRDDWHKELHDAARFADPASAARLWPRERAAGLLCEPGTIWFVVPRGWVPPTGLEALQPMWRGRHADLLRGAGGQRAGCP